MSPILCEQARLRLGVKGQCPLPEQATTVMDCPWLSESEEGVTPLPISNYHFPTDVLSLLDCPTFNFPPFPKVPQIQDFGEVKSSILKGGGQLYLNIFFLKGYMSFVI